MFVTLLSNFVPLSMYVTLEMVNFFCLWLVYVDREMYDPKTDTRALARSTNVTDLGQVQYIFSDKTGTLTQNVMRFKRCSVDGMVFGAPVDKIRPGDATVEDSPMPAFHPRRQLVVGKISYSADMNRVKASNGMTFNAEMFVRVMSLCHTVVVEKDLDNRPNIDESKSVSSGGSGWMFPVSMKKKLTLNRRGRSNGDMSVSSARALETVSEEPSDHVAFDLSEKGTSRSSISSGPLDKGRDGAPAGFAYQAESPDENALVSEASKTFGFQVIGRNSSGIVLRCEHPTVLSDEDLVSGLKNGTINSKTLVSNCATGLIQLERNEEERLKYTKNIRTETWEILAVNKFDSERKRMSILLRSPPELGSAVILFCKGADSAMLDPDICSSSKNVFSGNAADDAEKTCRLEKLMDENDDSEWDAAQLLGIQSHLGEFASEGLRTLVLGIRFLTDTECEDWLKAYKKAASSLKNRDEMLRDAALEIEKDLHVVGATAVEDKLQSGVPDTIATLEKAGIKLWVLTGDKKETAIEIGYSTKVLTPSMHLTDFADQGVDYVRAQCAMEFMRLVKAGKLPLYQKVAIDQSNHGCSWENFFFAIGKRWRSFLQSCRFPFLALLIYLRKTFGLSSILQEESKKSLKTEQRNEKERLKENVRRRNVRNLAEQIIKEFKRKYPKSSNIPPLPDEFYLSDDDLPRVFNRAESARSILQSRSLEGGLTSSNVRNIRISQLTAQEVAENEGGTVLDEDILSLKSVCLATSDSNTNFDHKKRTVLERLFAVDRDVRKGRLLKHMKKDKNEIHSSISTSGEGPRAMIIEGNSLKYILGDGGLEELLFNIASQCDAVIACRVSPQQKALLVKLVRHHVVPEPVTLAIGDGANDVGMIQEAHVGIGISGLEGKQAVNASDFAIAQFRFLESLLLVHGRWDFMRQATVVLFSFYKNAVMAGLLIVFNGSTLYSGQSLFDQWMVPTFNFLVFFPIFFLGIFDKCLEKDYIRKNPEVYQPTRQNEILTMRVLFRWILMTVSHIMILYFGSFYYLSGGGGNASSFSGLMQYRTRVGDGEGTDLQSVGLVIFSSMVLMLAYKVLYESRSIINGKWPPWWKTHKDRFWSRVPYTWYGITYGSLYFYFLFFLPIYQVSEFG
jgi:magnesium-transporting ATPase (P-type)